MPLYSFGSNGHSQLSLGHTTDVSIPTLCKFHLPPPPSSPPSSIIPGANHTLLLFPTGEAYSCGLNHCGQCGFADHSHPLGAFHRLANPPPPEGITNPSPESTQWGFITAGWEFTILATKDGKRVFACGTGAKGELGLGSGMLTTVPQLRDTPTPAIPGTTIHQIPNFPPEGTYVISLASSIMHVIAVLNDGSCFGWGASRKHQLHHPKTVPIPVPKTTAIPRAISPFPTDPFPVAKAVCTQESTFLISSSGDRLAHLGLPTTKWKVYEQMPPSCLGYVDIQASWNGVYILKDTGKIVAWGRSDNGRFPPKGLTGVKMMAVGSEHVIAVLEEDGREKLVAWGWGEHGNCGDVEGDRAVVPLREVEIPGGEGKKAKIRCIGAGCATSWVWVDWE
ncbi:RCC1/BLIP-II [Terfezia boudieri ATCC MYA-4762]|uniref:RCC1/BLIP-II n=1 Tax=Terfezia boudieri ATCC MYA-4762 TaxID=1051890 RepID=A0A3N4LG87_9PEZI|nr:RCC1/BLIP-II [Terfezia boudieri ATCC MYA-4762]